MKHEKPEHIDVAHVEDSRGNPAIAIGITCLNTGDTCTVAFSYETAQYLAQEMNRFLMEHDNPVGW